MTDMISAQDVLQGTDMLQRMQVQSAVAEENMSWYMLCKGGYFVSVQVTRALFLKLRKAANFYRQQCKKGWLLPFVAPMPA